LEKGRSTGLTCFLATLFRGAHLVVLNLLKLFHPKQILWCALLPYSPFKADLPPVFDRPEQLTV
jgi:hypothetical protein